MTLIFNEYRDRLERRRRSQETIYKFTVVAQRFLEWCEKSGIDPQSIDGDTLERYFDEQPLAASTKKMHLIQLRAVYKYAHMRGVLRSNPTIDVELPRERDKTPRVIPNQHLRTALSTCSNLKHFLMLNLFVYTGARLFEVTKMKWEDINATQRTIEIIGKAGKRRLVPIHPALGELLAPGGEGLLFSGRWGGVISDQTAYRWLAEFCPGYSFHDFRRTVASSLDANGVGPSEIDEIMGWAPRTVFERHYRRVAPERLQQAILKLYADDPL